MNDHSADVIVIGLGAVGSAVAHHLARGGARVVGIDRFHPPHKNGSSHGHTRITRLAVGEGAAFVPLVMRSHALWRELEAETSRVLYTATGGLTIASALSDTGLFHGQAGFFARTTGIARDFGIAHELLSAAEVRHRFPQFLAGDHEAAYFEPESGVLFPERCVAAQLQMAQRHGALLHLGEQVQSLSQQGGVVRVLTDQGPRSAPQVVLTAGAWTPGLVGGAWAQRLAVRRQVLHWWDTSEPEMYAPRRSPVFVWLHGPGPCDAMYGFPMIDGVAGVKVATEDYGATTDPDAVDRSVSPAEVHKAYEDHVKGRLAQLQGTAVANATCLYTCTTDGNFLVDRHPEMAGLTIVSACSGHGFKHSAGLGQVVAQSLLGQTPHADLDPFLLARQARGT